jgi:RNA polymerase sigma-70 factor, ECF subfamily
MLDPDSDHIKEAKAGNKAAFGKLVDRYYDMVYAVAFGILSSREAALDTAQEVFIKAYKEIGNFEGKSKFKTWVYRIAVNAAIDEGRKRRPSQSLDATDASDDDDRPAVIITDHKPGPRDKAAQKELRVLLDKAIQELSPEHRAVIVLREWEELSYEDIAEMLGIQMGTVMSRLFYARKKLGEILSDRMQFKDKLE